MLRKEPEVRLEEVRLVAGLLCSHFPEAVSGPRRAARIPQSLRVDNCDRVRPCGVTFKHPYHGNAVGPERLAAIRCDSLRNSLRRETAGDDNLQRLRRVCPNRSGSCKPDSFLCSSAPSCLSAPQPLPRNLPMWRSVPRLPPRKASLASTAIAAARRLSPYNSGRGAAMRRPASAVMSAIRQTRKSGRFRALRPKDFRHGHAEVLRHLPRLGGSGIPSQPSRAGGTNPRLTG
jgi:hypothetical protein